jgi:hypothetical protein
MTGDGHVDPRRRRPKEVPVNGGTEVAERGTVPTSQNRSHAVAVWREVFTADGVDTAVNADQIASREASLNPLRIEAQAEKLGS